MKKDAASRFASVAELAVALLPFAPLRAVVSAQRSRSIMSAARGAQGGDPLSQGPPGTESPTWRAFSCDAGVSGSRAPLRPLLGETAASSAAPRSARRSVSLRVVAAAVTVVAALSAQAYRALGPHGGERATVAAASSPPVSAEAIPSAARPVALRAIDAVDVSGTRVDVVVARSLLQKRAPLPHPPTLVRLGVLRAPPPARPVTDADAAAPGAPTLPVSAVAVELGY